MTGADVAPPGARGQPTTSAAHLTTVLAGVKVVRPAGRSTLTPAAGRRAWRPRRWWNEDDLTTARPS